MKVLLDECVTRKLKSRLPNHQVATVREMHWNGLRNGNLMRVAVEAGFDVLLTIDKNLEYQQNLKSFDLIVVVFDVRENKVSAFEPLLSLFEQQLQGFSKGVAYRIENLDTTSST